MAGPEQKNFAEKTGLFIRNAGTVVGLVGIIGALAGLTIGETLFEVGLVGAGVGEVGRKAAGSK